MEPRRRDEGHEPRDEIERLEHDGGLLLDEPDDALDAAAIADLRARLVAWRDERLGRSSKLGSPAGSRSQPRSRAHRARAFELPLDGRLELAEHRVRHA